MERAAQEAAAEAEEVAEAAAAAEAAVAVVEAAAAEEADAEDADAEEAAATLIPMARPPLTIAVSKASAVHVVRGGQPGTARLCARRREPA